jgi:hypothetical protein
MPYLDIDYCLAGFHLAIYAPIALQTLKLHLCTASNATITSQGTRDSLISICPMGHLTPMKQTQYFFAKASE